MTDKQEQAAIDFLYKHGDLTYSAASKAVRLLTGNGFRFAPQSEAQGVMDANIGERFFDTEDNHELRRSGWDD